MSANILFIGSELIKSRTGISDAIDDKQINPHIKVAQDMYIQPALGSTLYKRLQTGKEAANLSGNETTLIDEYLTDALVWYTMSMLPVALGYQFFSKGVLQKTAEESQSPSRADLELLGSHYKAHGEYYCQRMIQYLRENYHQYSEYINTGNGLDVIFPELRAYTCPIFLGVEYDLPTMRNLNMSSTGTAPQTIEVTPATGVNTFTVAQLSGKLVINASRSGLVKGITTFPTSNTAYLQIVGSQVTLPTGDVTTDGELFTFTYR